MVVPVLVAVAQVALVLLQLLPLTSATQLLLLPLLAVVQLLLLSLLAVAMLLRPLLLAVVLLLLPLPLVAQHAEVAVASSVVAVWDAVAHAAVATK